MRTRRRGSTDGTVPTEGGAAGNGRPLPPPGNGSAAARANDEYAPPEPPAFAVRRDRLVAVIDLAVQHALAVVVGPSGSGKTVLLSQWAASHATRRVRWLTLSPEHNGRQLFARSLVGPFSPPWCTHYLGPAALGHGPS